MLHTFDGIEGSAPDGLIFDQAGSLYGTTLFGGDCNCGIVFELVPIGNGEWKEKILHSFTDGADGGFPAPGLLLDQAGNLYGTTEEGGSPSQCVDEAGCGVVFELTPNFGGTWTEKVLHQFTGSWDGGVPFAGLIFDQAGNLYGTAAWGGNHNYCTELSGGCGVVFKLIPNSEGTWSETVLHTFLDDPGAHPQTGVIFDAAGDIYSTTEGDNITTYGSVFEIMP